MTRISALKRTRSSTKITKKIIKKVIKSSKKTVKKVAKVSTVNKSKAKQTTSAKHGKNDSKVLDLALLMDCTASMMSWITRSKETLR
jgi:hypothetical protein